MKFTKKNFYLRALFVSMIFRPALKPCPTCVGRLDNNSPAFFSDEFCKAQDADSNTNIATANPDPQQADSTCVTEKGDCSCV